MNLCRISSQQWHLLLHRSGEGEFLFLHGNEKLSGREDRCVAWIHLHLPAVALFSNLKFEHKTTYFWDALIRYMCISVFRVRDMTKHRIVWMFNDFSKCLEVRASKYVAVIQYKNQLSGEVWTGASVLFFFLFFLFWKLESRKCFLSNENK